MSKNFIDSLKSKLHPSKGKLNFGTLGRIHADWRLILILYIFINLILIVANLYLFFAIKNHQVVSDKIGDISSTVPTLSLEELEKVDQFINEKNAELQGLRPLPETPSL